ncbi:MAG TPA: hypothetical protein VFD82_19890 [Planctomycetota bacterium]|nr:hypothetical protein [Planctomycetota bacterium]
MALTGDGKRVSFLAGNEGGTDRTVVLRDQPIAVEGFVVGWPLAMTEDARVIAYQLIDAQSGKASIAVDGRRGELFDAVGTPVLSDDGKVVAHRAQLGESHFVVIGDRRERAFDFVKDPALSADGTWAAYAGARGGQWFLVVDGNERAVEHEPADVFVGPDRRCVGWTYLEPAANGGSTARVVVGERRSEPFDLVGRPVFSADGSKVAWFAERADRSYIVAGDRMIEIRGRPSNPVWSRDGRQLGFGVRLDRELWWNVVDCP